jgi:epoxyqueuosine reductase
MVFSKTNIAQKIKEEALKLGFLKVGICDASSLKNERELFNSWLGNQFHGSMDWLERTKNERADPRTYFPDAKSIIVLADNYYRAEEPISQSPEKGNISTYARGRDYHKVIRKKLKYLLTYITEILPDAKGRICVDSFPIMEKPLAVRAGIGWVGKHTNLIIKGKGSYFFLGEILLNQELPADKPLTDDFCGICNRCQVACPTDALQNEYVIDASRCISYLTIEHKDAIDSSYHGEMGNWIFGCDICQEVCPWNNCSEETLEEEYHNRVPVEWLDLEKLLTMQKAEFDDIFSGTPVMRAGYESFKRNVRIAYRNQVRNYSKIL